MTKEVNGSGDGGDGDEAEPVGDDVGIGECGGGNWVGGVNVVIVCCPSEVYAVEGAADNALRRNDTKELSEGKLLEDIV